MQAQVCFIFSPFTVTDMVPVEPMLSTPPEARHFSSSPISYSLNLKLVDPRFITMILRIGLYLP